MRNDAAHGHFDAIGLNRTRLMVDAISLFMAQQKTAEAVPNTVN